MAPDVLQEILQIPFGKGEDHAEGMTRYSTNNNKATALLLVNDAASANSKKEEHILIANIFELDT